MIKCFSLCRSDASVGSLIGLVGPCGSGKIQEEKSKKLYYKATKDQKIDFFFAFLPASPACLLAFWLLHLNRTERKKNSKYITTTTTKKNFAAGPVHLRTPQRRRPWLNNSSSSKSSKSSKSSNNKTTTTVSTRLK